MSDITDVLMQDAIAESLVSEEGRESMPEGWGHVSIREAPADTEEDNFDPNLSPEENLFGDSLLGGEGEETEALEQQAQPERQQPQPEQQEQQQLPVAEPTPQEVQQGIEGLDRTVEQFGLNDANAAAQLAYDISAGFGGSPESVDAKILGSTMAKTVLSAAQVFESLNGQPENLGPIPAQAAQAFTADFLKSFGIDAREHAVDSQLLADVFFRGTMNFIQATKTFGPNASLQQLNNPEACEMFVNTAMQALGVTQPMTRQDSIKLADAYGRFVLSVLPKIPQAAPQRRQSARSHAKPGRNSTPKMRTNTDMFGEDAVAEYRSRHARL